MAERSGPTRVLILGGSSEATALVSSLAGRPNVEAILSLAGRTQTPAAQSIPTRIGGFGGIDGLTSYLRAERINMLVDATHPFAARMSQNAREASQRAGCQLIRVSRPPWRPRLGDHWHEVATMEEAVQALGATPKRVFLTVGSLQLAAFRRAPQHRYLIRTIDPVGSDHGFPHADFIEVRGPFDVASEERLMRDHHIEILVTKNSGGAAAEAKLIAARNLTIPVVLAKRPEADGPATNVTDAIAAIESHGTSARRGV